MRPLFVPQLGPNPHTVLAALRHDGTHGTENKHSVLKPHHHPDNGVSPMNPVQAVEAPQLYGHSLHAGGWPKLGWQQVQDDADTYADVDDAEESGGRAFS